MIYHHINFYIILIYKYKKMSNYIKTNELICNNLLYNDTKYKNIKCLHIETINNFDSNTYTYIKNYLYLCGKNIGTSPNNFKKNYIYLCTTQHTGPIRSNFEEITPNNELIIYVKQGNKIFIYNNSNWFLLNLGKLTIDNDFNDGNNDVIVENNIKSNNTIETKNKIICNKNVNINKYRINYHNIDYGNSLINYIDFIGVKPFYGRGTIAICNNNNWNISATNTYDECIYCGVQYLNRYITYFKYIEINQYNNTYNHYTFLNYMRVNDFNFSFKNTYNPSNNVCGIWLAIRELFNQTPYSHDDYKGSMMIAHNDSSKDASDYPYFFNDNGNGFAPPQGMKLHIIISNLIIYKTAGTFQLIQ